MLFKLSFNCHCFRFIEMFLPFKLHFNQIITKLRRDREEILKPRNAIKNEYLIIMCVGERKWKE